MQAVHVAAPAQWLGGLVDVDIDAAHPNSLSGRLAPAGAGARGAARSSGGERSRAEARP
jgi:hypothetical protein